MFDSMFGSTPFSGVVSQADFPTNGATGLLLLAATLTPTEWTPVAKAISGGGKDYASSTLTSSFKGLVHWWWLGAAGVTTPRWLEDAYFNEAECHTPWSQPSQFWLPWSILVR